jgi:uncharacterized protein YjbJ (UPF0337 family)
MGLTDSVKNAGLTISGRAKQVAGVIVNDGSLKAKGRAEQARASLRRAGSHATGAVDSLRKSTGL